MKKPIAKRWWFWVLILFVIGSLGKLGSSDDHSAAVESAAFVAATAEPTATPEQTTEPTPEPTATPSPTDTPAAEDTPTPTPEVIVYKTDTGSKYHRAGCSSLSNSQTEITLDDAIAEGLTPCQKCNPPTK